MNDVRSTDAVLVAAARTLPDIMMVVKPWLTIKQTATFVALPVYTRKSRRAHVFSITDHYFVSYLKYKILHKLSISYTIEPGWC